MDAWTSLQDDLAELLRHARREVLNAKQALAAEDVPPSSVNVSVGGVRDRPSTVLHAAEREWRRGVREPVPGRPNAAAIIDSYIRTWGLGWATCDIVDWKPGVPYTRNGMFAWCGAFAATCYAEAGLKAEIRRKVMPGTPRLYKWARGTPRFIAKAGDLLRGDIVVVGAASDADGAHIAIFDEPIDVGPDGRMLTFATWEGNAKGLGPDGSRYEGVVRQTRPVAADRPETYRFTFGVRPLAEDYEGP